MLAGWGARQERASTNTSNREWEVKLGKVFYGWWVVGASFLIALYVGGVIVYRFTAIFEPVASEFGWSCAQISLAASLRGLEVGLLAPLVGALVDRWGPRQLIFGGVVITGRTAEKLSHSPLRN